VLRPTVLVDRGDRPKSRAAERPEPVLVDGFDGAVAGRRQIAAARDAHRVEALLEQDSLRADPDRQGKACELAQEAGPTDLLIELLADRLRGGPDETDASPARVGRPRLHERAVAGA